MGEQKQSQNRKVKKRTSRSLTSSEKRKRAGRSRREFNPDYTYVKQDLRRIAVLTGVFLTILVALSFVLR